MGRTIATAFLAALVTLGILGPATSTARADDAGWSISSFVSDVKVAENGTLTVAETIDVDFAQPKHGIERDFGLQEGPRGDAIEIDTLTATDAGGAPLEVDGEQRWPVATYRIGDPQATVTGHQTYHLSYMVQGMVGSAASSQERVDWPVTGTRWPVAMGSVKATFEGPAGALTDATCEVGPKGSESACPAQHDANSATFQSSAALPSGQGLRAVATLAPGAVAVPTPVPTSNPQTQTSTPDSNNGSLWLPLLVGGTLVGALVFSLAGWARRGGGWGSRSRSTYYSNSSDTSSSTWADSGSSSFSDSGSSSGGGGDSGGSSGGGDSGGGSW
jgi:predicted membrane protein DUF2207